MSETAETPADRRTLVVQAVASHRREAGDAVAFVADGARVEYDDRLVTLSVDADRRGRLDELLADYPVFKVKQPATRKAPKGTVHVSAIADPKHLADFVEDCFRRLYGLDPDYQLAVK